jgi:hypothetical protein
MNHKRAIAIPRGIRSKEHEYTPPPNLAMVRSVSQQRGIIDRIPDLSNQQGIPRQGRQDQGNIGIKTLINKIE